MDGRFQETRRQTIRSVRWLAGLTALLVCAGHTAPRAATGAEAYRSGKAAFVEALASFTTAMAGTFGDEGPVLRDSLDAMQRAVEQWDAAISDYESSVRDAPPGVEPHLALAAVYLDRGSPHRALPELEAARRLAPSEPGLLALLGLVHGLLADRAAAIEAYERAARLDGRDPVILYELSRHLQAAGRGADAEQVSGRFRAVLHARLLATGAGRLEPAVFTRPALLQARGAAPVFPLASYAEGFRLLRAGKYGEAVEAFRRGSSTDPLTTGSSEKSARRAVARGSAALRRGSLREALALLGDAVAADPESSEAARLLGMAHWADERRDLAATYLQAAVRLRPGEERARLALADVLVSADRTDEAEHVLLDTLDVLPDSGQAQFRLGRLHHRIGRYPAAIDAFERAATLEPFVGLDALYELIGLTRLATPDVEGAVRAYRRRLDVDPNDADAHHALADTFLDAGRSEEALTEYLAALLVDSADAGAAGAIARIHLERREWADAVAVAQYALRIDPDGHEARYALATGLMRLGRDDEGAVAFEAFRRLQQEAVAREREVYGLDALRREAVVGLEQGDLARAVDLLETLVERRPGDAGLHADLGEALLLSDRLPEAIESFERALSLDPGADVHRQLAEAYGALGRSGKRRAHLEAHERRKEARLRAGEFR